MVDSTSSHSTQISSLPLKKELHESSILPVRLILVAFGEPQLNKQNIICIKSLENKFSLFPNLLLLCAELKRA